MLIRRFGQNRRNLGIATLVVAFLFCVYLYYDLLSQLKQNDERNRRLTALQNSLSTQLQVVYEHKSRLERAIQEEKDNHHKTKEAKQDLEMKHSREKQELQNRLQSINQKQQILQSQFDDLQKDISKSEADYQLLKSDYQRDIEEYKEKLFVHNQQCEKDKKYLNEEIEDLKLSVKETEEILTQCQEALKISQLPKGNEKNKLLVQNLTEDIYKRAPRLNQSEDSLLHISVTSIAPSQLLDDTIAESQRKPFVGAKDEDDGKNLALAFQPDSRASNMTVRPPSEDHLQAVPLPPRAVLRRPEPIQEVDSLRGGNRLIRGRVHRDRANEFNPAVIEPPNDSEEKQPPNKDLNEDEDQEDADEKNGQNDAADQKDEDDYQYDKNADDEEKNDEKGDDFPDAIQANKNLNKIQNPVYPDDVEVFNH